GARFKIDNGLADAIVLPHVIRFNASAAQGGLDKLASVLARACPEFAASEEAVICALETVFVAMGIPRRLRDAGVPREALPDLAAVSMEDWFIQNNPLTVR